MATGGEEMTRQDHPAVIAVVGPTATGKTHFGVRLAQELNGEVISGDSMQLYRGMEIGTAAPTPQEQCGIPHHLIGVLSPSEPYCVADYCRDAGQCVADILERGRLPIFVGGTGLYLDSLLTGLSYPALPDSGEIRAHLAQEAKSLPTGSLHRRLASIDPQSAARLHPNDLKRVIRALEVYALTGRTLTELGEEARGEPPYRALRLGLDYKDRSVLYDRIDRRVDRMVDGGLLEEVRRLAALPDVQNSTALQAIGFKEFLPVLRGELSCKQAADAVKLATRHYAKRQRTWFYRDAETHWFYRDLEEDSAILSDMLRLAGDFL